MKARLTLIGLYNYLPQLFDGASFPEGIDKATAIATTLCRCGEMPLLYPNGEMMQGLIKAWSDKWYDNIARMLAAVGSDYNPIYNYDRFEDYTDDMERTETGKRSTSGIENINTDHEGERSESNSENTSGNDTATAINDVSAFNDGDYQPSSKNTNTGEARNETTGQIDVADGYNDTTKHTTFGDEKNDVTGDEKRTHKGHLYGNIGVTTTMAMILEEMRLRQNVNIYDVIAEIFCKEFCIPVY
jgi:hypothetical protein